MLFHQANRKTSLVSSSSSSSSHCPFSSSFVGTKQKGKLGRHLDDESSDTVQDCDDDEKVVTIIQKSKEQIVADHTKWLACSYAFDIGETCSKRQRFVPEGYFFETGRALVVPDDTTCADVTATNSVTEVKCRIKRGLTMVLPVYNSVCVSVVLDDAGKEQPEPLKVCHVYMWETLELSSPDFIKATLDGEPLDTNTIILSPDKDVLPQIKSNIEDCPDRLFPNLNIDGYPITAGGPYVFLDTSDMRLGEHELVLIGGMASNGCVSGVKHTFVLTRR
jgi:hypothetical protein